MKVYIQNFKKYKGLLIELVIRDIKVKYKRSVLGLLWTLLNPLLTMLVLSMVFSNLFKNNINNFPVYLIIGQVMFSFFSEATGMAMESVVGNAQLIKKVYIPKYIFPISKVLSSFVNLLFALIAIFIVTIVMKLRLTISVMYIPLALIYIVIFATGIGLILASVNVYFRDMRHLYGVVLTAWMYLTPIFYPIDIIPEQYIGLVKGNPLIYMIQYLRECILYGNIPDLALNITCLSYGVVTLVIGLFVFYKSQDRFILYI